MAQHTIDPAAVAAYQFGGQDIPWLIDHWAEHRADHPFLIWEPKDANERTWTYAEFAEATKKVAAGLAGRGVGVGDMVLIHAENCPEAVIAWYACARVGAVAVTTNTRSVAAEVNYFITHTRCVGAITQPKYAALVAEAGSDRLVHAVPVICAPGDVCINSRQTVHGSFANTSPDPRVTINFGFHRRSSVRFQCSAL